MEAVLLHSSPDNSTYPYKQHIRRNYRKINNPPFISLSSCENFAPSNFHRLHPPLLPLPISRPYTFNDSQNRGLLCPLRNRNRTRDHSRTPKKSKLSTMNPKKEPKHEHSKSRNVTTMSLESLIIEATNRLGPEPEDLPKEVQLDKFSGSVAFTRSPPPSSLPLPMFSLRPKLSCNVEAVGVDAGATESLRRLLHIW